MDWALAVSRNRQALLGIVAQLFALAGVRAGGPLVWLPRAVAFAILLALRPAEAAARRLIVIAAHGLALKPRTAKALLAGGQPAVWPARAAAPARRAFVLFDPLKPFDLASIWGDPGEQDCDDDEDDEDEDGWPQAQPAPARIVNARLIGLRLNALMRALEDLPGQARRLVRWRQRRDVLVAARRPVRWSPMRPGLPPGWRQRAIHAVDPVLKECHRLANGLPGPADTS